MKRARLLALSLGFVVLVIAGVVLFSGGRGYLDALSDTSSLRERADALIAAGRGGAGLGTRNLQILLAVEDPGFHAHNGIDVSTPGAGMTTITQSLSKRLAFESFRPGFGKIRQSGYALGLEKRLSKDQILALWLESVDMGPGPEGWMTGFHEASRLVYAKAPAELAPAEFMRLVAVLVSPNAYRLLETDAELDERVRRISKLIDGHCAPSGFRDVWLEGCR